MMLSTSVALTRTANERRRTRENALASASVFAASRFGGVRGRPNQQNTAYPIDTTPATRTESIILAGASGSSLPVKNGGSQRNSRSDCSQTMGKTQATVIQASVPTARTPGNCRFGSGKWPRASEFVRESVGMNRIA